MAAGAAFLCRRMVKDGLKVSTKSEAIGTQAEGLAHIKDELAAWTVSVGCVAKLLGSDVNCSLKRSTATQRGRC